MSSLTHDYYTSAWLCKSDYCCPTSFDVIGTFTTTTTTTSTTRGGTSDSNDQMDQDSGMPEMGTVIGLSCAGVFVLVVAFVYVSKRKTAKPMEADDQREGQPQPMNETRTTMPTQTSVVQVVSPIQHRQAATPTQHVQTKPQRPTTQPRRNTLTLPKGWRRARTADGKVYYQNDITKTTQWTLPTSSASQSNLVKSEKNPPPKYAYKEDNAQIVRRMTSFKSELDQLLHVIDSHMEFMKTHEKNVDKIIAASGEQYANLLRTAKDTALAREKEILNEIMNISTMDQFLNDIILVENLFNSVYTADQRDRQRSAREKYAPNMAVYESKPKPHSKAESFVDLVFYAKSTVGAFKKWLQTLTKECQQQKIRIISNSGAKEKNIERGFYKSFYVYGAVHGEYGYLQMTDVLRCSLVFDDFNDLYGCFGVIEKMMKDNGGILRCKDRFHPKDIPFGYRDLLLNIHCPGSNQKVICEVQLHHKLFYQHKEVSHAVYKKARIFEDKNENNMAYQYSNQHVRKNVGDKLYEYEQKETEDGTSKARQLLEQW
eukprot:971072_1